MDRIDLYKTITPLLHTGGLQMPKTISFLVKHRTRYGKLMRNHKQASALFFFDSLILNSANTAKT